jgi:hypothetical protein
VNKKILFVLPLVLVSLVIGVLSGLLRIYPSMIGAMGWAAGNGHSSFYRIFASGGVFLASALRSPDDL